MEKTLLKEVKSYIDNYLNPVKKNIIDSRKNVVQPFSIFEVSSKFQIADDDYCTALSISNDNDFELHLKRKPNSCFINNYFVD